MKRVDVRRASSAALVALAFACSRPEPAHSPSEEVAPPPPAAREEVVASFDTVVAPILAQRCVACHGEGKSKGGLRLHAREAILAGGESGSVFVAGSPGESELMRRVRLPVDDEDHMPPEGKPQPSERELRALEAWIAAGAPFEGHVAALAEFAPKPERAQPAIPAASEEALAALRRELVHVELAEPGSQGLRIDFAAVAARTDDELAKRLLQPVEASVAELSLARSRIGDAALETIAKMPALRRLDLRGTAVGDEGLSRLARHPRLAELVLAGTRVGDSSVAVLAAMPALERVYLWHSGVSAEGLARLRASRATLAVVGGDEPDAVALEAEPKPTLTSDAPIPGAPVPGSPDAPVNAKCPVTGDPVNPKYTLLHAGRRIGFCCPNCPAQFQAAPDKFAANLP